jgi:subtilisin family serine protease
MLGISASVHAQTNYYFYVQLANKNNSPYSLNNPSVYLSQRAINRRSAFKIVVDSTDLPVNPAYVSQIENLGVHVHCASKWMNGVTVKLTDSTKMSLIRTLPFVKFVQYTGLLVGSALAPAKKVQEKELTLNYGIAAGQITQLNGTHLHDEGFRGKGIHIGVIDAGFTNVNVNPCFDSLRLQGRLLGTKDIINPTSNIYAEDTHGAMVLSAMTGNLQGQYLGTAPDASFWLIRTEYSPTEYKVETDFWCAGIEFADSVGVDIATSSLGYYTFDDPKMNFSYADMTGKVSRASRAATIAGKKGIVVLVAAGNEGQSAWHYIGSPADADGIISVGGVTSAGVPSLFTSFGPSYDGRVKPEICATGTSSALVNTTGALYYGSGTSFATPIMAGMIACLLQKYKSINPNPSVLTLLQAVYKTGNMFSSPTAQMGYGIPDFVAAEQNLFTLNSVPQTQNNSFVLSYNPVFKTLIIRIANGNAPQKASVKIYAVTGKMMVDLPVTDSPIVLRTFNFAPGIYAVCISENGKTETRKILIK